MGTTSYLHPAEVEHTLLYASRLIFWRPTGTGSDLLRSQILTCRQSYVARKAAKVMEDSHDRTAQSIAVRFLALFIYGSGVLDYHCSMRYTRRFWLTFAASLPFFIRSEIHGLTVLFCPFSQLPSLRY
ncbi:hypothetical protein LMH87_001472 [Akanthomyces muscarius]|uniref:Uncharacterized protein n=1 Tax=Akanthomyces muscarius TaxID=2231603 RepID=A0A9W8UI84_AKAMU|nr:hypothetical protein LMH87_001472 [Akanthomyces muscarius]KAJ4146917.1 hypothetical protein LMH87_001472 [Akanthomyces muscarius]